jgi:hypothetical protein
MKLPTLKEIYKYIVEASSEYPDFNRIFRPPTEPPIHGVPSGEVDDQDWNDWQDLVQANPAMREPFDKGDWQNPLAAYSPPRPVHQQLPQAPGRRQRQEFTPQQTKQFRKMAPGMLSKLKGFFK